MSAGPPSRAALARAFAHAAAIYWAEVYPLLRHERLRWRHRAAQIPDPVLRRLALEALKRKWANVEGAGAFATFVGPTQRTATVRTLVAFQAAYDYADTISEQPGPDHKGDAHQLHTTLFAALDEPGAPHSDYYAQHPHCQDNGYLQEMVDASRSAFAALPSHTIVAPLARRSAERIATYQSLNHGGHPHKALAGWGRELTPPGSGLHWWETCAAGASSMSALALIAAAANPNLSTQDAHAINSAYFPWIGALHTLLDSLIDYTEDTTAGQYSLIEPYGPPAKIATAMHRLATESKRHAHTLPNPSQHLLLLGAMTSLYLTANEASHPHALPATRRVLHALGDTTAPAMPILTLRRALNRTPAPGLTRTNHTQDKRSKDMTVCAVRIAAVPLAPHDHRGQHDQRDEEPTHRPCSSHRRGKAGPDPLLTTKGGSARGSSSIASFLLGTGGERPGAE